MKKINANFILLGLSLLTVIGYQAFNLTHRAGFEPFRLRRMDLFLTRKNFKTSTQIAMWGASSLRDASSKGLASFGYTLRYLTGNYGAGGFFAVHTEDNLLRLYPRWHIPLFYPAARLQMGQEFIPDYRRLLGNLKRAGITTLLLPVPAKLVIEREHAPTLPASDLSVSEFHPAFENPFLLYQSVLDVDPIHTVDLQSLLFRYHSLHLSDDLYAPLDTHWVSLATALTAKKVLETLAGKNPVEVTIKPVGLAPLIREDDFVWGALEKLPHFFIRQRQEFNWRETLYTVEAKQKIPCRGRLIYVGSSNSERLSHFSLSLPELIQKNINCPMIQAVARSSKGFQALATQGIHFERGDKLIWEFPTEFVIGKMNKIAEQRATVDELIPPPKPELATRH